MVDSITSYEVPTGHYARIVAANAKGTNYALTLNAEAILGLAFGSSTHANHWPENGLLIKAGDVLAISGTNTYATIEEYTL